MTTISLAELAKLSWASMQEINLLVEKGKMFDAVAAQRDALSKLLANARHTIDRERQMRFDDEKMFVDRHKVWSKMFASATNSTLVRHKEIIDMRKTIATLSRELAKACEERDRLRQTLNEIVLGK